MMELVYSLIRMVPYLQKRYGKFNLRVKNLFGPLGGIITDQEPYFKIKISSKEEIAVEIEKLFLEIKAGKQWPVKIELYNSPNPIIHSHKPADIKMSATELLRNHAFKGLQGKVEVRTIVVDSFEKSYKASFIDIDLDGIRKYYGSKKI